MANVVRRLNLVLSYKGNKYKGYKWILALLKPRGLVKELVVTNTYSLYYGVYRLG